MSNSHETQSDALQHSPSFDQMVAMIEKLFKDYLTDVRKNAITHESIEKAWQRYKTLNHLYQDGHMTNNPNTQLPADLTTKIEQKAEAYAEKRADTMTNIAEYNTYNDLYGAFVAGYTECAEKMYQSENNTQLPAEWKLKIENEAEYQASLQFHKKYSHDQWTACVITYRQGATEYATKLQLCDAMYQQSKEELSRALTKLNEAQQLIKDWEDVDNDHKRLVREIDNIITGGMPAKQASLCDLVRPIENLQDKHNEAVELLEEAAIQIEYLHNKFTATGSGNNVLSRIKNLFSEK
jgi:hypothetical protein